MDPACNSTFGVVTNVVLYNGHILIAITTTPVQLIGSNVTQ